MAVYFDHKISPLSSQETFRFIKFHSTYALLAIGSVSDDNSGSVNFYCDEGELITDSIIQRDYVPTDLCWHPNRKILAVGWANGEVFTWNEEEHELHKSIHIHRGKITILEWSSHGSRLVSGDNTGVLLVWKADSRGRLQAKPLCQHDIKDTLAHIVFRPSLHSEYDSEIADLARAAVSGDENALDLFTWKRGSQSSWNNMKTPIGPFENFCFYVSTELGIVYYINDQGVISEAFRSDGPVIRLLYHDDKNILVTITDTLQLARYAVMPDGTTGEAMKVKLSGRIQDLNFIWAGKGILALTTGENVIRLLDLDKDDNYVLSHEGQPGVEAMEGIISLAFCANKGLLAGGTNLGNIIIWKWSPSRNFSNKQDSQYNWKIYAHSTVEGSIKELRWGSSRHLLGVNTHGNAFILNEQIMCSHFNGQIAAVQTHPSQLQVDIISKEIEQSVKSEIPIKGIFTTKDALVIWSGKKVIVYEVAVDKGTLRVIGSFYCDSENLAIHEQSVFTLEPEKVQVRTYQGTVKQVMPFTESDGDPIVLDICNKYLVVGTHILTLKMWNLAGREAKPHSTPKNFLDSMHHFGSLISVRCNCMGTKVSLIVSKVNGLPDSKLYVWDVEYDILQIFNFATGQPESIDYGYIDPTIHRFETSNDVEGRYPLTHFWDNQEEKLLVCEAHILPEGTKDGPKARMWTTDVNLSRIYPPEVLIVSLFATSENSILVQDNYPLPFNYAKLIGSDVPYFYFLQKYDLGKPKLSLVAKKTMRDFVGMENSDKLIKDALMNFSYFLTIGNMDEAFKAIKLIKSESVWENMAKMCVKTKRLDVASVCLGNMGHARGARALREALDEPELDARVAMLAVQLGLQDEAERLYRSCKRYDLLNQFYQDSGQWGKAMETAEFYDRVHVRTTYYNYAKHLEAKGDINGAIPNYEKSETHRFEVPRMLFDEPQALESYIMKSKDKDLRKWWAQYMESTGEMETALQFYETAQDYLSLVRVYCFCGNLDKAAEIANETGDKAASYHLGRQYENQGNIKSAIHFFTKAQTYSNAIRLCKEHDLDEQLLNLALMSSPEDMIEAGRYYETRPGLEDKAVMLFHKAGLFRRAIELAFSSQQFAALQLLANDLNEKTDPELLSRCAKFFIENGQYDKAVDLLAVGKQYSEALDLCVQYNITMTENLAEVLTIPKEEATSDQMRADLLEKIAECCMQQRLYHLATKKFTQAGNKVKAMKALLKSGDTEKIIFFANVSRLKEIYIMAANYLQAMDWRKDPDIMKNIIGFYTKGRALDLLAGFYDACAQVEIDEYQNYEKALGALNEAQKCLTKARVKDSDQQGRKLEMFEYRIDLIKKFITARRIYDEDSQQAMQQCQLLLKEKNLSSAVRVGDVYGFMIEHYSRQENYKTAYNLLEEMRTVIPSGNIHFYVDPTTIETIHKSVGVSLKSLTSTNIKTQNNDEEYGEEVQEEVDEDLVNGDDIYH